MTRKQYKISKPALEETPEVQTEETIPSGPRKLEDTVSDNWDISLITSTPILFFSKGDETLSTTALDQETLESLIPQLNSLFLVPEEAPESWMIRYPEVPNASPVLSLTKGSKILATLPLTQEILASLMPPLKAIYKEDAPAAKTNFIEKVTRWVKTHKALTILSAPILLIVIASMLLAAFTQITASF